MNEEVDFSSLYAAVLWERGSAYGLHVPQFTVSMSHAGLDPELFSTSQIVGLVLVWIHFGLGHDLVPVCVAITTTLVLGTLIF